MNKDDDTWMDEDRYENSSKDMGEKPGNKATCLILILGAIIGITAAAIIDYLMGLF